MCGAAQPLQDADRTPWPTHSPAIPTVWEGVEEPLSTPVPPEVPNERGHADAGIQKGPRRRRRAERLCEGGSLAVDGGAAVAQSITDTVGLDRAKGTYAFVVATKDWHQDPGEHWATGHDAPNFVDTWPVHCGAETPGAEFHDSLNIAIDELFLKGRTTASYTGLTAARRTRSVLLGAWLTARGVTAVDVVGLATDHCVRATALDAKAAGFDTRVLLDHCAGVAPTPPRPRWPR